MGPGPAGIPLIEYLFSRLVCIAVPLGFIALLVILVIAGLKYLTSAGEAKAVQSAHSTVIWGLLGTVFLALAWLILQLIQNFTGVEVTKFTLSSLPGVQGFTGSCWESPPVTPVNQLSNNNKVTSVKMDSIDDKINEYHKLFVTAGGTCNKIGGFPFPVTMCLHPCQEPSEYLTFYQTFKPVYTDKDIKKLSGVIEKPTLVDILVDAASPYLYQPDATKVRFSFGGNDIISKDLFPGLRERYSIFAQFYKDHIPENFIKAKYDIQQIAKQLNGQLFNESGPVYIDEGFLDQVQIFGLSCNDYNYLAITSISPLIYFYPTKTTTVKAYIESPIISVLKQEENSWNILVKKNGTFEKNGISYRFIPYEFLRNDFKRPERGFVVDIEHSESFLKENLWKKLGLSEQEIEDYWQDIGWRIPKANYYFVSLIDRSEIDRVLPMEVNPQPDTVIRNMTYILPLDKPFIPIPIKIKALERKGFTVLENGGFIDGF